MKKICAVLVIALLAGCGGGKPTKVNAESVYQVSSELGGKVAKYLFGEKKAPSQQSAASYGSYAKGCLAGGQQLAETGPTWQAMRLSRNRNYGHPELVDFVQKLSRNAAQQPGWAGIYVGDMSLPRGGPVSGHAVRGRTASGRPWQASACSRRFPPMFGALDVPSTVAIERM